MIDDRQRIAAWSYAASVALGISEEAALGRSRNEVVRGRDPSGRPIRQLNCPPFKAIQKGHLFARCSLVLPGQETPWKRFIGELVALPAGPGGAFVTLSERRERQGDAPAAIDAYETAVNLYRGDLLEDESYAQWCREEREFLRKMYLDTLMRVAGLHMEQSASEKSVESYRRALAIDPLQEENHRGLMRASWAAGRRDEALRQYQICREILLRELDVGPQPETVELEVFIRGAGER